MPAWQVAVLEGVYKLSIEHASGKNRERPKLKARLDYVRKGDTMKVKSADRLARSTIDLLDIISELDAKHVTVEFVDTPTLNIKGPMGRFFLTMLAAMAGMECVTIRERQTEGIAIAKAKGIYKRAKSLPPKKIEEARRMLATGMPKTRVAKTLGVSRQTLYNALGGKHTYAASRQQQ